MAGLAGYFGIIWKQRDRNIFSQFPGQPASQTEANTAETQGLTESSAAMG